MNMTYYSAVMALTLAVALGLIVSSMQPAHAGAAAAAVMMTSTQVRSKKTKTLKPSSFKRKGSVDCNYLRYSPYVADREVYGRYCK